MIVLLRRYFSNKRFVKASLAGLGFHIFISFVLFILLYVVNYTSNSCRSCDSIILSWNSISWVAGRMIGLLILDRVSLGFYRSMIVAVPVYLVSPISFGFLCGYVLEGEESIFARFKEAFLYVYLPIWIVTIVIVVLWVGFDL
jgi:hypothetical protein